MTTAEKLVQIGGKLWNDRVYFNNLRELYDLNLSLYKTGNISGATVDGETVSNSAAKRINTDLKFGKVFYHIPTNMFHVQGMDNDATGRKIVSAIESRIANL